MGEAARRSEAYIAFAPMKDPPDKGRVTGECLQLDSVLSGVRIMPCACRGAR